MSAQDLEDYILVVVAHPDDETLFFSSVLLQSKITCKVLCITDGNADGQGDLRKSQFMEASRKLGVQEAIWWGAPDIYEERLDHDNLMMAFKSLPTPKAVYTHGPIGEYMHPHHQDISYAAHKLWASAIPVFSVAYNCFPDEVRQLNQAQFKLKSEIVTNVYGSETNRFLNLIPCRAAEGFVQVDFQEVEEIYKFLSKRSASLNLDILHHYQWLKSFLEHKNQQENVRAF